MHARFPVCIFYEPRDGRGARVTERRRFEKSITLETSNVTGDKLYRNYVRVIDMRMMYEILNAMVIIFCYR